MSTIHGFLKDTAFIDRSSPARLDNPGGGLCLPSEQSLSYFQNTTSLVDTRATRPWISPHTADTLPVLYVDGVVFADFITHFASLADSERDSLFAILDRLVIFNQVLETVGDMDTDLSTEPEYSIYKPGSLSVSSERVQGEVFNAAGTIVEAPAWVQFSIFTTGGSGQEEHELKVWVDDAVFKTDYPISAITELVPILPYSTLLTGPLSGGGSNVFEAATTATDLIQSAIDPKMRLTHQTGLYLQNITFNDQALQAKLVPFGILHKGLIPDLLSIRTEIREAVLASGVGTEAAWRLRAPELFIVDQFYIIPMWDVVTVRPDGSINPSLISVAQIRANTKTALPALSGSYIDDGLEVMSVVYNAMQVGTVPHPENINYNSIFEIHDTYQNYAASEPGFANMEEHTKTFSNRMNTALPVAAGVTTNPLYPPRQEADSTYIPFVVGTTEYYIMTKESYLNKVGE